MEEVEAETGEIREEARESQGAIIKRIFEMWKVRTGHSRAKLDDKRRSKIRQRLCDGYTEKDLLDAIEGCALSPFHCGKNDMSTVYNDIELICRDAKHVDQFITIYERDKAMRARQMAAAKQAREEAERLQREREARQRRPDERSAQVRSLFKKTTQ